LTNERLWCYALAAQGSDWDFGIEEATRVEPMETQSNGAGNLDPRISRRQLLQGAAGAGLALSTPGFLAAYSSGEARAATAEGVVKRGGTLRVGHAGGGKGESFNPARGGSFIDTSRQYNLYDPLVRVNPDLSIAPGLALEWNPNKDSTIWQIKLRPDVTFHNGKPFTADDVVYTLRSMGDAKHVGHFAVANVRLGEVKKINRLTVRVPLKSPNARLYDSFVNGNTVVIPNGTKSFSKPVGTGPFVFDSFTVGERSHCVRNPNYWEEGKPYVDAWEDISIDDPDARLNALLAGEIDAMSSLDYRQARAHKRKGDIRVIDAPSPSAHVIYMAIDRPPFTDNRVRQAFRLIADRQALIDGAIAGFGTLGNDLFGKGLPYFAELPVRRADPEKAKSLLKAAGAENLKVTLHTSNAVPGFVEAATLFAQQAKAAGVTVNVKREPANAYFDTSLLYTKLDFGQDFWAAGSLGAWYELAVLSDAVWNETHWRKKSYDKLIRRAQGAPTKATANRLWREVQQIQYDQGGYILWTNVNIVDAAAKYVRGVVPSSFTALGGWNYRSFWLDR
jgi:peptide/nickel transport system substrate-binding protein